MAGSTTACWGVEAEPTTGTGPVCPCSETTGRRSKEDPTSTGHGASSRSGAMGESNGRLLTVLLLHRRESSKSTRQATTRAEDVLDGRPTYWRQ